MREEGGRGGRLRRGSRRAPAGTHGQSPTEDEREQPGTWGQPSEPQPQSHGASQNHLHHGVRETAKTSDMNSRSRRAANQPGFSLGGSKLRLCLYFQPCANTSPGSLAPCGFFSLLTRDTNWNHLFSAAPCAEQTPFPNALWSPRPPSHPCPPKPWLPLARRSSGV